MFETIQIKKVEEKPKESKLVTGIDFSSLVNHEESVEKEEDKPAMRSRSRSRSRSRTREDDDKVNEYSYKVNERHHENWIRKGLIVKVLNKTVGNGM